MTLDPLRLLIGCRSDSRGEAKLGGGAGSTSSAPPSPQLALNKEMEGPNAKEGGSSLEKGAAETPPGCYSGEAALGKHISWETEQSWTSGEARQVVSLNLL